MGPDSGNRVWSWAVAVLGVPTAPYLRSLLSCTTTWPLRHLGLLLQLGPQLRWQHPQRLRRHPLKTSPWAGLSEPNGGLPVRLPHLPSTEAWPWPEGGSVVYGMAFWAAAHDKGSSTSVPGWQGPGQAHSHPGCRAASPQVRSTHCWIFRNTFEV